MRALCDSCESAPAIVFCAADEAALCGACDDKVHLCNKLANRHIRVGLANPSDVPHCDVCENSPAFFYCEVDGSSLCLQCDTIVHVGGKRTHERYLLLRQRVEFLGDKLGVFDDPPPPITDGAKTRLLLNQPLKISEGEGRPSDSRLSDPYDVDDVLVETDPTMIDLNMKPHRIPGQASNDQLEQLERFLFSWNNWSDGGFDKVELLGAAVDDASLALEN